MKLRVLLAGVLGGIVLFNWGYVAHMVLPLGMMGMRNIPDEGPMSAAIRSTIPESGMYMLPGWDFSKPADATQMKEQEVKLKKGPSGLMILHPGPGDVDLTPKLIKEVITNIVSVLLAAAVGRSAQDELRGPSSVRDEPRPVCLDRRLCAELELVFLSNGIHACEGGRSRRRLGSRRARSGRNRETSPASRFRTDGFVMDS